MLNSRSKFPIGLDISDLSLKLIQLNKRGSSTDIQTIGTADIPEGIIVNGDIKNFDEAVKTVSKLLSKPKYGKVSSKSVIACLPETKTFIKLIEIEKGPNAIEKVIQSEIEKHVPFGIKEIYYDWQIINEVGAKQSILVAAVPKIISDQYIKLLNACKLTVEALEIESVSISRALLKEESPEKTPDQTNYGIIDIGAGRTSMILYSKNSILFTVSMPISGRQITEQISKILEIDLEQAEKAKLICGLDDNKAQGVIKKILSDTINDLTSKIQQSIAFYNNHFPDRGDINQILLCGGGSNIKNLDNIIHDAIGIEVQMGNTFTNLKGKQTTKKNFTEIYKLTEDFSDSSKSKSISLTQDVSLSYTTAIGLSLRNILKR